VPMIVAGDEISRTQKGNNNAYCQDNEISWLNWEKMDKDLLAFTHSLIKLRKEHPAFCRRRWFQGQPIKGAGVEDIAWFLPDGNEMTEDDWNASHAKSIGIFLFGKGMHAVGPHGEQVTDDSFYIIFNAHHESLEYKLPCSKYGGNWTKILDTATGHIGDSNEKFKSHSMITIDARSVVVLHHPLEK
jgi:isoamylase